MWCLIKGDLTIAENYKKRGSGAELQREEWASMVC